MIGSTERHELTLSRTTFAKEFSMSRIALENLPQGFGEQWMRDECYRMSVSLFGLAHEMTAPLPEYSYPADWWQATKERWFPRWLLRRYPVRLKRVGGGKIAVDVHALFPELDAPRRQDKMRIYYHVGTPVYVPSKGSDR